LYKNFINVKKVVEVAGIEPASRSQTQRSLQAYPVIDLAYGLSAGRTARKPVSFGFRGLADETRG